MKWQKNLENLATKGKIGKCPYCQSENTDYNATKVVDNMGYAVMWCNDCKHSNIISKLEVTNNMKTNQIIPNDLI